MSYQGNYPPSTPLTSSQIAAGAVQPSNLSTGGPYWDGSGNVGIGLVSPAAKLDVVGASGLTSFTGTSFLGLQLRGAASTNDYSGIGFSTTNQGAPTAKIAAYFSGAGSYLQFGTSNSYISGVTNTAMTLDYNGNLLVGTTSSTGYRLSLESADNQYTMRNSGATAGKRWRFSCDTNNTVYIINQNSAGVYIGDGSSSWSGLSDERAKDIIEPIQDAANKVCQLRAVIGKYKIDDEGTRRSFLIAQDVQSVLPEAVSVANQETGHLGLSYTDVIPLLVAALQEAVAKIDTLEARIATLEAK